MNIIIARRNSGAFSLPEEVDMYKLRYQVFYQRLQWQVSSAEGQERDDFDDCNPIYMLVREHTARLLGCWRMLPTTGSYMLRDTFPELLHGQDAPAEPNVWELSRFAVSKHGEGGFGFSDTTIRMIQAIIRFGGEQGIVRYVTVTTVAVERMLRRLGMDISRFGPPLQIGIERAVALNIEINEKTNAALFNPELEAMLEQAKVSKLVALPIAA
ncbi:acyl-homoserine-lactone synthase [Parachitinimonas caeni]|uniref:Acyl-homoserine-lactone synthase n=1 Tax=Parachitinimonas caeni TaxID=3031301 RepID=A0ABT7E1V1_9NEIS|nr:acyl-homoserine-lactone synthase [Parachitinimonas caeni]MDK2125395.1 acyl-homoserine-lactone synthase [Parachitinimonas caeni]